MSKFVGKELKYLGNDVWHGGNFNPNSKQDSLGAGTTSQYLRGDGTWATPPNTTYSVMSVAEGTTGTATSSRTVRADYLKQIIQNYIPTSLPADGGNADTVDGKHASEFAPSMHTHGNITDDGKIGSTANLIVQTGSGGVLTTKGAGTTSQFLRGDGNWATPTNTTYSEITTAEIDAGTASTLRTITGRRIKYIFDKVQTMINGLTKSDIGLGSVQDYSIATQTVAETGTSNSYYMTPLRVKQAIDKALVGVGGIKIITSSTEPSGLSTGDQWHREI